MFVRLVVLCFCLLIVGNNDRCAALESSYEKEFDGGFVTVEVSDSIVFSITVTEGSRYFCGVPTTIWQDETYEISTDKEGEGYIQIDWTDFNGCDYLYTGQTAIGTMSEFPPSFNIQDNFIIYCGIWAHGDYFVIDPGSSSTTTSTTLTTSINTTSTGPPPPFCLVEGIYGENGEEAELLRQVRDDLLNTTDEGRELIRLYYQWSFMLAETLKKDDAFRKDIKAILDDIIPVIEDML